MNSYLGIVLRPERHYYCLAVLFLNDKIKDVFGEPTFTEKITHNKGFEIKLGVKISSTLEPRECNLFFFMLK